MNEEALQAFKLIESVDKDLDYLGVILSHHLGGPVCISNCGDCCHQSFIVPEISAQYIAYNIKTQPGKNRGMIEERLEKWLRYKVPGVRLNFSDDGTQEATTRQAEYEALAMLSCPFLDDNKRCLIYPWRDFNCRAWGVTRPMAAVCRRPVYEGETPEVRHYVGPENPLVKEILGQIKELEKLLAEHIPDALRTGWLPTVVYRLLKPEGWRKLAPEVQESKAARYEVKHLWLITKDDADKYAKKTFNLKESIKI